MTTTSKPRSHSSYRHEAFLYRDDEDFLAGVVPFVMDGVAAGQPVMVAIRESRLPPLRAGLGPDARDVHFVDMTELGHATAGPGCTLRVWAEPSALVCEVRGPQPVDDPMAGRRRPQPTKPDARGLWPANQMCDLVQVRSTPEGSTVRVVSWR